MQSDHTTVPTTRYFERMQSGKFHIFSAIVVGSGSFITGIYYEKFLGKQKTESVPVLEKSQIPRVQFVDAVDNVKFGEQSTTRTGHIMKYGSPTLTATRVFDNYVVSYDKRTKTAAWVFEHLTRDNLYKTSEKTDRNSCRFAEDNFIHPLFRATNEDFLGSGYDRGHLAPAANQRTSQESQCQTFFLTNIAPQVGKGFNRDSWNKLEKYTRFLTKHYKDVYVCTGSLFLPKIESDTKKYVKYEVIGRNHVAVPTHFYKVLLLENIEGEYEMEAYLMPNEVLDNRQRLGVFQVPPNSIERAAGFHIFDRIPKEHIKRINGEKFEFN